MHTKILVIMSLFPTHFAIIFFTFIPFSSAATNANYSFCSNLYSCGSIRNIGYPFWGAGRPDFCGRLEFHLNCVDVDNSTRITIPSMGYAQVVNINTSSHIMSIVPTRFVQSPPFCQPHDNQNQTTNTQQSSQLSAAFKICPSVTNITLFYGCNQSVLRDHPHKSFDCLLDNYSNGSVSYFSNMSGVIKQETTKSCRNYSVMVLKTELGELKDGREDLLGVLRKGIELEYVVNFTACSACQKSGGNCGSSPSSSSSKFVCYCPHGAQLLRCLPQDKSYLKIALLVLGIAVFFTIILVITIFWSHKKLKIVWRKSLSMIDRTTSDMDVSTISFGVPVFSYDELREATRNFHESNVLGDGGFGTVYYGKLKDGREVAVKRLYEKNYRRVEQFMNEVRILTCLKHPNLVILYGCTSRRCNELLLVYEYISNGTVADHLYNNNNPKPKHYLPWHIRMNIAIETASALAYLHASEIVHRDVKTSNILLDNNFNVKVADFGLSRLLPIDVTHVSTAPQGTPGYLDPEYYQNYQLTDKSDVYSFGVVLVELISSLPAVDMERHKQEVNLSNYAMSTIKRCAFNEVVDAKLGFMSDYKVRGMTISVAELAFRCLQHDKESRPSMEEVVESLRRIQSADYEELKADDEVKIDVSSLEKDDATLLRSDGQNQLYEPSSPKSVMDKWASRFTTPNTSK